MHNERYLVDTKKLLKLIFFTSTFNFIPRIIIFFLFYLVNDDKEFGASHATSSVSLLYIIATTILNRIFIYSYFYRNHIISLAINNFSLIYKWNYA